MDTDTHTHNLSRLLKRYERAKARRRGWENHWQDCYDYALPGRGGFSREYAPGHPETDHLFDGTAMDAVDQLTASLLGRLTPPGTSWFGFKPGPDLTPAEADALAPVLEQAGKTMQAHFDRSNFSVEIHQSYLDLVVGGTAVLLLEETDPGSFSAFQFTAVPLRDVVLEEGENGYLDGIFRTLSLTLMQIKDRYPDVVLPPSVIRAGDQDEQARFSIIESVLPSPGYGYDYHAVLMTDAIPALLTQGMFHHSPAMAFRWMKSPGEMYGRSPIMKALPDIKTANKVVELILKNASIAATGIWQADDDGVLNPANIELVPGAIIPKAVGSQGLKALEMPGRFDVSQLVLEDLRARIRHALLTDKLGQINTSRMTATEVLERSSEMTILLGATYGRLQCELLTPLIRRAYAILRRRGEIPDIALDGRYVTLDYRMPLARAQGQQVAQDILIWMKAMTQLGSDALSSVDMGKTARYIGDALGIPADLIRQDTSLPISHINMETTEHDQR
ncbi:MAG: head-tail connector protein [Alphaproteobacteria bacterium]|nr:head-tail connector protein [Alphaproteobacteria bacterium]